MKYVRTLYGVYALKKKLKHDIDVYRFVNGKKIKGSERYYDVTIVAEADIIEELCDVFVMETKYNHYQIEKGDYSGDFFNVNYNYISTSNSIGKDNKEKIIGKFGAIWTDKGLIYVAKMNEKGKLELL